MSLYRGHAHSVVRLHLDVTYAVPCQHVFTWVEWREGGRMKEGGGKDGILHIDGGREGVGGKAMEKMGVEGE